MDSEAQLVFLSEETPEFCLAAVGSTLRLPPMRGIVRIRTQITKKKAFVLTISQQKFSFNIF